MVTVVDATSFLATSDASVEALKTANLLKGLPINAFVFGESGTGKKTLAKYILPTAPVVDASNYSELEGALGSNKTLIISNFDKIPNFDNFKIVLDRYEVRIIAIASSVFNEEIVEQFFGIKIYLAPLKDRIEDVKALADVFLQEATTLFSLEKNIEIDTSRIDLSLNAHSIRRYVYMKVQLTGISENEIMDLMEEFLRDKLGGNSDYRNFLYLYEAPLINAGLQKFKTQLQLSDKLGLNRNTLRKKIAENKEYLRDEQ